MEGVLTSVSCVFCLSLLSVMKYLLIVDQLKRLHKISSFQDLDAYVLPYLPVHVVD